jgi:hypothetical protein
VHLILFLGKNSELLDRNQKPGSSVAIEEAGCTSLKTVHVAGPPSGPGTLNVKNKGFFWKQKLFIQTGGQNVSIEKKKLGVRYKKSTGEEEIRKSGETTGEEETRKSGETPPRRGNILSRGKHWIEKRCREFINSLTVFELL